MAVDSDDVKGMAIIREAENRLVWLAAYLTSPHRLSGGSSAAAQEADGALDEYQSRFTALTADRLPSGQ